MAKHEYDGIFKQKQREFYSLITDGCANFYRHTQFDFCESQWINLGYLGQYCPRFQRDSIALYVVLSFKGNNQCVCIGNTHIHANQRNNDVKLWKVWQFSNIWRSWLRTIMVLCLYYAGTSILYLELLPTYFLQKGLSIPTTHNFWIMIIQMVLCCLLICLAIHFASKVCTLLILNVIYP